MLDHPTGGIGLGGEGLAAAVVVIALQLLSQLADGSGELLGLDAQLPQGAGALQGAGRARRPGRELPREERLGQ